MHGVVELKVCLAGLVDMQLSGVGSWYSFLARCDRIFHPMVRFRNSKKSGVTVCDFAKFLMKKGVDMHCI